GGYLFLKGEFYHLHDGSQASPKKKTELRIELRRVAMESTFGDYCFNDSKGLYLYECTLGRKTLSNSHYPTLVNCELGGGSLEGADQVLLFKSGNLLEGIYKPKRAILIGQDPGHMDWESGDVVILTTRVKRGLSKKVQEVHQVSSSFLNKVQRHLEESGEKMRSTDAKGIRKLASEAREDLLDMCGKYTDVVNDWPPNLN
ncbi:MAG: hypothetical protein ACE5FW_01110, partial [Candidatus Aenigmatarchaeota archaeon]